MESVTYGVNLASRTKAKGISATPWSLFRDLPFRCTRLKPSKCRLYGIEVRHPAIPKVECRSKGLLNIASVFGQKASGPVAMSPIRAMNAYMPADQEMVPVRGCSSGKPFDLFQGLKRAAGDCVLRTSNSGLQHL